MLFDEPSRFYASPSDQYFQQGDIVVAPTTVLRRSEVGMSPLQAGSSLQVLWSDIPVGSETSSVVADSRVSAAMIVSHDCALDKEFLRAYAALRRNQIPVDEAIQQAASDESLDRFLTVAPIIPFTSAAPSTQAELERNRVIGFYPISASDQRGLGAGVVNLGASVTIERHTILDRLGILSADARAALRYAMARYWLYRAPSLTFGIEDAIGKRIIDHRFEPRESLALTLILEDGSEISLVQPIPDASGAGVERPSL